MMKLKIIILLFTIFILVACKPKLKPSEIIQRDINELKDSPLNFQNIKLYTASSLFREIYQGELRTAAGINFLTDKDTIGFFYVKYNILEHKVKVINMLSIALDQDEILDNSKGTFKIILTEKEQKKYSDFNLQIDDLRHEKKHGKSIRIQKPNSRRHGVQFYSSQEKDESFIRLYSCSLKANKANSVNISDYFNFVYAMYNEDEYQTVLRKLNNYKFTNNLVFNTENNLDIPEDFEKTSISRVDSDFIGLPFEDYQ